MPDYPEGGRSATSNPTTKLGGGDSDESQPPTLQHRAGAFSHLPQQSLAPSPSRSSPSRTLARDYTDITGLVSQFSTKLTETKERMEELTDVVPVQVRLAAIWKEQAQEWSSSPAESTKSCSTASRVPTRG
jgi:hypothetical protein